MLNDGRFVCGQRMSAMTRSVRVERESPAFHAVILRCRSNYSPESAEDCAKRAWEWGTEWKVRGKVGEGVAAAFQRLGCGGPLL